MKLRTKVLLTIALTFIGLSAALFLISQSVLLGSFKELEEKSVVRNVGRVISALEAEIKGLDSLNLDWASWDYSYRFVVAGNKEYIRSNLNIETLIKQRLNLVIFLDASGKVVFARALSHETAKETPFPPDFMPHISPGSPFVTHTDLDGGHDGLIVTKEAVVMASSRPILTSEGKGPAHGTLIMGRYLDEDEVRRLAETTHLDARFSRYDEKLAAKLEKKAGASLTADGDILTNAVSDDTISGYGVLHDIYNKPALTARLDLPRDIYRQGRASLLYFISYLLAAALVSAAAIMLVLKKSVLSRLSSLGSRAVEIGRTGNLSERVEANGGDELASLAQEVNRMIESLEDLEAARKSAEDELRKARDELEIRVGERTAELTEKNLELKDEIAERKRAEDAMKEMIYHDYLTGLPNRLLLTDRLNQVIARGGRHKDTLAAVLFMDLDRFKVINDTLGHSAGDELIKMMASMLKGLLRSGDTVARLGGDEFTILLQEIAKVEDILAVAEKILKAVRKPIGLRGHNVFVTASIGVSVFPFDGADSATLLKNADIAMYHAKGKGGDTCEMYDAEMGRKSFERLTMGNQLRSALAQDEFINYYQPIYDIGSGEVTGAEALIRWQHAELGLVPPSSFIPLAEETGVIVPMGEWALKTACVFNKGLHDEGFSGLVVSVNVSVRMFTDPGFVETVKRVLSETGMEYSCLKLELTESLLMTDIVDASKIITELMILGVQFSIDDFGTGYSSFGYLKNLPINQLKIDRSFIQDIPAHADDMKIVVAIINLAHSINLEVVAEGVETEAQLDFLIKNRCDKIQGFLFSKPLPEEKFRALLKDQTLGKKT